MAGSSSIFAYDRNSCCSGVLCSKPFAKAHGLRGKRRSLGEITLSRTAQQKSHNSLNRISFSRSHEPYKNDDHGDCNWNSTLVKLTFFLNGV
jgi:hypothetical protein